jgi:hypothetical protein
MTVCEFLLQKEGDHTWIPIESPTVEILEGRYRIVARTQYPNTEMQMQVSYWAIDEMPPKRHTSHRSQHTNPKGDVPIMPFTQLRPGMWGIQCGRDDAYGQGEQSQGHGIKANTLEDFSGGNFWGDFSGGSCSQPEAKSPVAWRHSIRLQVLPQDLEIDSIDFPVMNVPEVGDLETSWELARESEISLGTPVTTPVTTPVAMVSALGIDEVELEQITALDLTSDVTSGRDNPVPGVGSAQSEAAHGLEANLDLPSSETQVAVDRLQILAERMSQIVLDSVLELEEELSDLSESNPDNDPLPLSTNDSSINGPLSTNGLENDRGEGDRFGDDRSKNAPPAPGLELDNPDSPSPLLLSLSATALVISTQQNSILLQGQLGLSTQEEADRDLLSQPLTLRVELRDPQSAAVVVALDYDLSLEASLPQGEGNGLTVQDFPLPFVCEVELPLDYQAPLLLGDVQVLGQGELNPCLASQTFTVSSALEDLLAQVAQAQALIEAEAQAQAEEELQHRLEAEQGVSLLLEDAKVQAPLPEAPLPEAPLPEAPLPNTQSSGTQLSDVQWPTDSSPEGLSHAQDVLLLMDKEVEDGLMEHVTATPVTATPHRADRSQDSQVEGLVMAIDSPSPRSQAPESQDSLDSLAPDSAQMPSAPILSLPRLTQTTSESKTETWQAVPTGVLPPQLGFAKLEVQPRPSQPKSQPTATPTAQLGGLDLPGFIKNPQTILSPSTNSSPAQSPVHSTEAGSSATTHSPLALPSFVKTAKVPVVEPEGMESNRPETGDLAGEAEMQAFEHSELSAPDLDPAALPGTDPQVEDLCPTMKGEAEISDTSDSTMMGIEPSTTEVEPLEKQSDTGGAEAFRTLNLGERFLERLTDLATQEPEGDWLTYPSEVPESHLAPEDLLEDTSENMPENMPGNLLRKLSESPEDDDNAVLSWLEMLVDGADSPADGGLVDGDLCLPNDLEEVEAGDVEVLETIDPTRPWETDSLEMEFNQNTPIAAQIRQNFDPEDEDAEDTMVLSWLAMLVDEEEPGEAEAKETVETNNQDLTTVEPGEISGVETTVVSEVTVSEVTVSEVTVSEVIEPEVLELDGSRAIAPDAANLESEISPLTTPSTTSSTTSSAPSPPPQRHNQPDDSEIVVEDERFEPQLTHWMGTPVQVIPRFPEDEPLPLPQIVVPEGELIAGQPVSLLLQLPQVKAPLCAKLWWVDCQTRTLAADPIWVTNFLPTLPGYQEARLTVTVPQGCLEVQIEAITIEPETQRESHKATLGRSVLPPELGNLPEEEETALWDHALLPNTPNLASVVSQESKSLAFAGTGGVS